MPPFLRRLFPEPGRSLRAVAAGLALLGLASAATPATAETYLPERLRLDYAVHVGGVRALRAHLDLALEPGSYSIDLNIEPKGIFRALIPWGSVVHADGVVDGGTLAPRAYRTTDIWRSDSRTVRLSYDPAGPVVTTSEPPGDEEDDTRVPAALTQGTRDPLSGLLALMARTAGGQPCGGEVAVYDGRRRYDLRLVAAGTEVIAATRNSVFEGTAQRCEVEQAFVAGKPWKKRVFDPDAAERVPPAIFVAPVMPGSAPVPVRVEMQSPLGTLAITLEKVDRLVQTAEMPAGEARR